MASLPSHGENRGSSPLGSANNINDLHFEDLPVSRPCPVEILSPRASPRGFNFDAFEPTVSRIMNVFGQMNPQHLVEQAGYQHTHLRHSQRRRLDFFPAWLPA